MKNVLTNNRGIALVMALVLTVILLMATGAGLLYSGLEQKKTGHHRGAIKAFFAAEAGLNHVWEEVENGDGVNDFDTIHAASAGTVILTNPSLSGAAYTVTLLESLNNPKRIKVSSVGTAPNEAQAKIEVWLGQGLGTAPKALITNSDLKLNGNPSFLGLRGGAHSNDDMQVSGNSPVQMADGLTASNAVIGGGGLSDGMDISGTPCIGSPACTSNPQPDEYELNSNEERDAYEAAHNKAPTYPIPEINPANYASAVAGTSGGYILKADCTVVTGSEAVFSNGLHTTGGSVVAAPSGWSCSGGDWTVSGNSAANGVFYAEGKVAVSGNPGSASTPWQATIIARDSVKISGNPEIVPFSAVPESLKNVLLVTGNDLEISGNPTVSGTGGGIFAHQQVKLNGNPTIKGFVMAGDGSPTWAGDPFTNPSQGVTQNEVSGNPTITYNGDFGVSILPPAVTQLGWLQSF